MIGLLRHTALFALTVGGCLVVTLGAASLGLRRAPFERVDTVTASSLGADYGRDARSELSPPLLLGIIDAAAQDDSALAQPGSAEPPRSESEAPSTPRALATPTVLVQTPALSPTAAPTRPGTATSIPTPVNSPTSVPATATPVAPKPTETQRPTSTPTRIINLPCGPPILPGDLLDGISDQIRPTCTPTPAFTPKPTSTPTPKLEPTPTPTRTPLIDILPDDWPLIGGL